MSIKAIIPDQQTKLKQLHENFGHRARLAGCSAAAASFLLIGALIVITCGCLCLMLPGVNVINHVILPAVVPGIFAILVSIPFILLAVKYTQEKNFFRGQMIDKMISHLDNYQVPETMNRKARAKFILKNFLNWQADPNNHNKLIKNTHWTNEYQSKILGDLTEKVGKDKKERNPRQEKVATALDRARAKLSKK